MWQAIYQHLSNKSKKINEWFQVYSADDKTSKPYGVFALNNESNSKINHKGKFTELNIWLYFEKGQAHKLDKAMKEVKKLLSNQVLTTDLDEELLIEYVNHLKVFWDEDLKAICRRIDFRIPGIKG